MIMFRRERSSYISCILYSERQYCDLGVWTPVRVERVFVDISFTEKLITKLTAFYVSSIIPQFVPVQPPNNIAMQPAPQENVADGTASTTDLLILYCSCQKEEFGKMIMCEGLDCP